MMGYQVVKEFWRKVWLFWYKSCGWHTDRHTDRRKCHNILFWTGWRCRTDKPVL